MLPVIGEIRPWADPAQVQINRLPAHVPLSGFERRSLDGRWSLEMFEHPDRVPAAALRGERSACVTVEVPGNWTMQDLGGFVDLPHYTNVQMPFPGPPPQLPDAQPDRCLSALVHDRRRLAHSVEPCCTSPVPRACTPCTSTAASSGTAPTADCRASTTSTRSWSAVATSWRSW